MLKLYQISNVIKTFFFERNKMAGCRVFTLLLIAVLFISESHAYPAASRDLFAEYENSYDVLNKNEDLYNVPNDYEDNTRATDDEEIKKGCNNGVPGGWLC